MVKLKEVDRNNFSAVIKLQPAEEQKGFVATNLFSMAQCKVETTFAPLAIYNEQDTLVGFTMYGLDLDDGKHWLARLMIDKAHQRKGYGRSAMQQVLASLQKAGARQVRLGTHPGNQAAVSLYQSLGFCFTGEEIDDEEHIMELVW